MAWLPAPLDTHVNFKIDSGLMAEVDEVAKRHRIARSQVIRAALRNGLPALQQLEVARGVA